MALLLNDFGHGKNTYPPSKGVPGLPEFEFNSAVGKETKQLLQGKVSTYEAQPFNGNDVLLRTRTDRYNAQWRKDKTAIGISSHANANSKPSVRGFGVFYWHSSPEAKKLAETLLDEYKKEFPDRKKYPIWGTGLFPSKPGTWTDLHMCRETAGVFVLVEWEFMTNPDALKLLKSNDYRKRCALVKARSVCRWYEIKFDGKKPSPSQTKPKPEPKPAPKKETSSSYKGNSIVEYLQSIGVNSSFSNRAKLAKEYGISNYKGTASQNLALLDKMRSGKPVSKPAPSPKRKGDMKTNSIVDYLKSIGENPSFSNRSKLAAKYGIKNYKGTAAQNIQLLKKMRG